MSKERTLAIIKPDAIARGCLGNIIVIIESNQFRILAARMIHITKGQAESFYSVHYNKPFFPSLTDFMNSGPSLVMVLEREDAISQWREVMGATNPEQAKPQTIRKLYGTNVERNATHGSDAKKTAELEIAFFFSGSELVD